jgi:hypothetical protein
VRKEEEEDEEENYEENSDEYYYADLQARNSGTAASANQCSVLQ